MAFVLLYGFPGETARLWAWPIQSHMTSMLLASAYLGGCYFFLRVLLVERRWAAVRAGFVSVALFATPARGRDHPALGQVHPRQGRLLAVGRPLLHRAASSSSRPGSPTSGMPRSRLPTNLASGGRHGSVVAGMGGLAVVTGLLMFVAPARAIAVWPWPLTPLTCRVVGATFCLGAAGLGVLVDDRWESVRLMRQVQLVMFALILVAPCGRGTSSSPTAR